MSRRESRKLCFVAPTGCGKTTAAGLVAETCRAVNIKLAAPLIDLQHYIYRYIGVTLRGEQDGELLQFLGSKIYKEAPTFMIDCFEAALARVPADIDFVTNDDCRPHHYEGLRRLGFMFVRVAGPKRARLDHSPVDPSHPVEPQTDAVPVAYTLANVGSMVEFRQRVFELVETLK